MKYLIIFIFSALCIVSCQDNLSSELPTEEQIKLIKQKDHRLFHATLRKQLQATASRDLETLKTLMNPDGLMHMIRPDTPIIYGTDSYLNYHESWFSDPNWSIKTAITDSQVGNEIGMALVSLRYEIPDVNGHPYWNELTVSYVLKKYDDKWFVISDHSSSIRESPTPSKGK